MAIPVSSLITVVIPVRDRADTLPRTLASIDAQTMRPAAVVLVDNASADASLSILHQWAASRPFAIVDTETRPGACAARNRGLTHVDTPYVMFFDSDDEMHPRHIEDFHREAERTDADILGRHITAITPTGTTRTLYFSPRRPLFNHIFRGSLSTQRIIIRTGLVRQVGGWDDTLPAWNDYELGVRLLLASPTISRVPGPPSVTVHPTPGSITGTSFSASPAKWERSLARIRALLPPQQRVWADARAMILAARYAAESAPEAAARLKAEVMARTPHPRRMELIYRHNIRFGRLTWLLLPILFPTLPLH